MAATRIVKAACPQCGAGLHIAPGATVVTCDYCKLSSLIQRHDAPKTVAPTDGQQYGTIQVDPQAGQVMLGMYLAVMGFVVVLSLGLGLTSWVTETIRSPSISPPSGLPTRDPLGTTPASAACEKTVACCKTALGGTIDGAALQQSCNAYRMMSDGDCVKQLTTLRQAATARHRTCN